MSSLIRLDRCRLRRGAWSLEATEAIDRSEIVLVTGTNGSGKTTLLRMLAGVGPPYEGQRVANGTVCYLPADITMHRSLSCRDMFRLTPDEGLATELLGRFHFSGSLEAKFDSLSFGNARKLLYAVVLSRRADLTLLDEVSAGIDSAGLEALYSTLAEFRQGGQSFVLVDQSDASVVPVNRILRVKDGSVHHQTAPGDHVQVRLSGPLDNLPDLLVAANRFDFAQESEP